MNLRIYEGFPVFHMLQTSEFREGWLELQANCPWATVFTHPDFVEAWLRFSEASPLLAVTTEGRPVGLLVGAAIEDRLVLAGGDEVPVHGWLAEKLRGSFVIESHLAELIRARASTTMVLGPGAPTDWLSARRPLGRIASPELVSRRRVMLDPERAKKNLDKKRNTSQMPRLRALGDLLLWEADDLPTYVSWHEKKRRDRGLPGSTRRDRIGLYRRLDKKILMASELRAGDEVLSAMLLYLDGDRAWLELFAENPKHERHSPGMVHLLMLEEQLLEDGVTWIDVSADDDWMHLLAEPYEATAVEILFSRRERAKRRAVGAALRAGKWVMDRRR